MKEELYYYWLDNVPGIGRITMRRLIEVISPRELYEQGAGAPGLPLREKQRKQLDEHRQRWRLEEEWEGLKRRLFDETYLHEWSTRYHDPEILDGEQWEVTLKLTNRRKRSYSGSNAFPPYWIEFLKLLRPHFEEAGQKLNSNGENEDDDSLERIRDQLVIRSAEYFMFMND